MCSVKPRFARKRKLPENSYFAPRLSVYRNFFVLDFSQEFVYPPHKKRFHANDEKKTNDHVQTVGVIVTQKRFNSFSIIQNGTKVRRLARDLQRVEHLRSS